VRETVEKIRMWPLA